MCAKWGINRFKKCNFANEVVRRCWLAVIYLDKTMKRYIKHVGSWLGLCVRMCMLAVGLIVMMSSCGHDGTFRIDGMIKNFGTGNLRVVYFSRGAVQSVVAPAVDGKFSMMGYAGDDDVVARVYTGKGVLIGRVIAAGGNAVEVEFDATDSSVMNVGGNDDSKAFARFLSDNAELIRTKDVEGLNGAVAAYVKSNPESLVSGLLLHDYFSWQGHEAEAQELTELLLAKVVNLVSLDGLQQVTYRASLPVDSLRMAPMKLYGRADSLENVNVDSVAVTLLMITDVESRMSDSIESVIMALGKKMEEGKLQIVDLSCDTDTVSWHKSLSEIDAVVDSLKKDELAVVKRVWMLSPYSVQGIDNLSISCTPWFVVADSTGTVLYNGSSVQKACEMSER